MTTHTAAPSTLRRSARFGGLDGLRTIAVALVLVYHLFPDALPGGFLGVDVFFAISGFLITSLLLREYDAHGRISLGRFWRRRARRLLPALALVLLVCTPLALLADRDLLVGIGAQLAGAALFVSNWVYIAAGADYFTRDAPELFRNTWSLSIEEQFYIVLPLLILVLCRFGRRGTPALVLAGLGVASGSLMAVLSLQGAEATRIYFGSDAHTFGLLFGAALACLLERRRPGADAGRLRTGAQLGLIAVAALGLTVLGVLAWTLPEGSPASFRGGFQLATVAALATVWAVTRPGAWAGLALDAPPLRWIGERSYGIYLWHWPLLLISSAILPVRTDPAAAWAAAGITLTTTVAAAALSYRFVEQPIRRLGLRRTVRRTFGVRDAPRDRRVLVAALAALLLVTVPATGVAVAQAPERSSAASAIERGRQALDARSAAPEDGGAEGAGAEDGSGEAEEGSEAVSGGAGGGARGANADAPVRAAGPDISAVGDSVMLASLPELDEAFPGIAVDAEVSRGLGVGVGISADLAAEGELRRVIVVGLGTNGPVDPEDLAALNAVAGDRGLVLVNAYAERDWIPGVNAELAAFADAHRGVVVADWAGAVDGVPDALAGDGIHPNPSGGVIYAEAVQRAIDALETPEESLGFALPRR
ncbi:acetyltransferase [Leucobacter allii]|uniref:Acetyltransferase n=1 Tax=Leucobacter allii TaxID=2932247 RepID=A0ABY4FNW4_9MICO|nr:acyltransferase family protein [Leucobacter allii]UOQ57980.1 acetyltransferase [Leucobacter allii]